ncbi:MAG: glycosyltransferase [Planctomycetota bacterium]
MRLLMLCERFPPDLGGLATSGARIAGALVRLGVAVDVVAWTRACPPGALETLAGADVHPSAAGVTVHRVGLYASQDFSLQHTLNVLEWLHSERAFAAAWGHYLFPAGFTAVLFAASQGIPSAVSARGNDVDRATFPPGDFARLLWTLERASLVTAASADLARKIDVLLGRARGVEVVPNAVDPQVFSPGPPDAALRARLGIAPDEAVLCFAGELRQKKGFPFLLDALRAVRAQRPACLLVVGEVRPREQSRLQAFAAEHPADARRILISGRLDEPAEVARHLRLADAFLLPSLWEGMPNALLEAMAVGVPSLASGAGGIPEVLAAGQTGFVLPRHQLHRLGEATLELLALPAEERARIGAAARQAVLERFHPDVEAARLREVLARLQATGAPKSSA